MKRFQPLLQTTFFLMLFLVISCSSDDSSGTNVLINTAEMKLFVIDTAKVNTINSMGTDEVTILNKLVNTNSDISDFSISPDGKQFIYINHQVGGLEPTFANVLEIRKANIDGSGDVLLRSETNNYNLILRVKYCSNNKIIFTTLSNSQGIFYEQSFLMNDDGTGLKEVAYGSNFIDITLSRAFYLIHINPGVQIMDSDSDNGMPGIYHTETISGAESKGDGVFTNDGKKAVIPYKQGSTIKARIIDMATKTSSSIDLIKGLDSGWISYQLEMSSDGARGVITISGENYTKSKTYVFNIKTGVVNAPFENNDENVSQVYAW